MHEPFLADTLEPISDFIEVGDQVVVRFSWRAEGRGPGADTHMTTVIKVREGKIFRQRFFWDHAEALEVAGLHE